MISENIDTHLAQRDYRAMGRCRIDHFLSEAVSQELYKALDDHTEFDVAYACSPEPKLVSAEAWRNMDGPGRQRLHSQLRSQAAEGRGFLYCTYIARRQVGASSRQAALLDTVFDFWGGEALRRIIFDVTGIEVTGAECQFTRFTPGQYLTRHRDTLVGNRRKIAFVLGMSRDWHPDWGGLLHFYRESGEIEEVWIPRFNTLQIFDITHIHGVSAVAPCAPRGRYSLTGWFTA